MSLLKGNCSLLPFLLGSHHPVQFHQIRPLTTGMAINTSRTLTIELSEHSPLTSFTCGMVQSGLAHLHTFLMTGDLFLFTWDLEPNGRSSISSCNCKVVAVLSLKEMHTGSFACFYDFTALLPFLESTGTCFLLLQSHLTV